MGEILNRREQIIANKLPPEIPDPDTLVSKTDYATASKAGVVKIGNNINVSSGKISVPAASDETAGVVKIGENLSVDENGFLNAAGGGGGGSTIEEILDNSSGTGTGNMPYVFPEGKTAASYKFFLIISKTAGGDIGHAVIPTELLNDSTACRVNSSFTAGTFYVANVKASTIGMDSSSGAMALYKVYGIS